MRVEHYNSNRKCVGKLLQFEYLNKNIYIYIRNILCRSIDNHENKSISKKYDPFFQKKLAPIRLLFYSFKLLSTLQSCIFCHFLFKFLLYFNFVLSILMSRFLCTYHEWYIFSYISNWILTTCEQSAKGWFNASCFCVSVMFLSQS